MLVRGVRAAAILVLAFLALRAESAPIDRTPEFVTRVNAAIARGAEWLRAAQSADPAQTAYPGYPLGIDALSYHTLRVCGVPRDDAAAKRAWDSLRRTYAKSGRGGLQTYTAALILMAIAEHGDRVTVAGSDQEVKLSEGDRRWAEEVTGWLVRAQTQDGVWSYGVQDGLRGRAGAYDHSNTQYATLGLKAAARCGIAIPASVWSKCLNHFLDAQDETGPEVPRFEPDAKAHSRTKDGVPPRDRARGWGYAGRGSAYGSMTAGAVGAVVICRSELMGTPAMSRALDARSETSVRDGLAWLGRNFTVRTNPGPRNTMAGPGWHYYYVYALERAGVLAGVEWMADRDWYGEGAEYLCAAQAPDGGWSAGMPVQVPDRRGAKGPAPQRTVAPSTPSILDTCFALLFLKKGTIPVRRGALTIGGADDGGIRFESAADLHGRDFEDLIDLILLRWRRSTDEDVRRRLFEGAASIGPRIVEPLLRRMDSPDLDDRTASHACLTFVTGLDKGYRPAASRDEREESVVQWQAWWISAQDRLRYDRESKRLAM